MAAGSPMDIAALANPSGRRYKLNFHALQKYGTVGVAWARHASLLSGVGLPKFMSILVGCGSCRVLGAKHHCFKGPAALITYQVEFRQCGGSCNPTKVSPSLCYSAWCCPVLVLAHAYTAT